jgi:formylglycine-generating enzyme required for sulfatase activity
MSKIIIISILLLLVACSPMRVVPTVTPSRMNTPFPMNTSTPSKTPTETLTPTSTPFPKEIMDSKGIPMRLVLLGEFTMGIDRLDESADDPEQHEKYSECHQSVPICERMWLENYLPHRVNLDTYYIDKYEVTNVFYKSCVDEGACQPPQKTSSYSRSSYYGNPEFDNYPVIYVDWYMAKTYCEWRGARLPTEAEWEKAARGPAGLIFPWGANRNTTAANYDKREGDTVKVGSYENGKSVYGVYDMSGNVWEWVNSLFAPYPYSATDGREDMNATGNRVLRGGSWVNGPENIQSAYRSWDFPTLVRGSIGFRCVRGTAP